MAGGGGGRVSCLLTSSFISLCLHSTGFLPPSTWLSFSAAVEVVLIGKRAGGQPDYQDGGGRTSHTRFTKLHPTKTANQLALEETRSLERNVIGWGWWGQGKNSARVTWSLLPSSTPSANQVCFGGSKGLILYSPVVVVPSALGVTKVLHIIAGTRDGPQCQADVSTEQWAVLLLIGGKAFRGGGRTGQGEHWAHKAGRTVAESATKSWTPSQSAEADMGLLSSLTPQ